MFARPRASAVRAFTPPALPGFFAKPALIPTPTRFCQPPFYSCAGLLGWLAPTESVLARLANSQSSCVARCRLRPRDGEQHSSSARGSLWLAAREMASALPTSFISGLTTGFSVLRFTSQPFLNSVVLNSL